MDLPRFLVNYAHAQTRIPGLLHVLGGMGGTEVDQLTLSQIDHTYLWDNLCTITHLFAFIPRLCLGITKPVGYEGA